MKKNNRYFLVLGKYSATFLFFLVFCLMQKPLFNLVNHKVIGADISETLRIMYHGLPLDLGVAGYLTIIPSLLIIFGLWTRSKIIDSITSIYYFAIMLLLIYMYGSDLILYGFWGFRLDSTPLFYFMTSPKNAIASVPLWQFLLPNIIGLLLTYLFYRLARRCLIVPECFKVHKRASISFKMGQSVVGLLLTALLILPIRGGLSTAVLNTGHVYYSDNIRYNHAAINPCFSLLESVTHATNFDEQYRFMSTEKALSIVEDMVDTTSYHTSEKLLTKKRPNIIFVQLESFMAQAMMSIGTWPDVQIYMDSLAQEGLLFTHFYANSFRTDRGLFAMMSGFPAQPTTSAMKYPRITQQMPAISQDLKDVGYALKYYYGGDINFTNQKSYLVSHGFEATNIVSDQDFPLSKRLSKWGAHDEEVYKVVLKDLQEKDLKQPFFKYIQTSSSHEPFEVPFHRLKSKEKNALAYADSCLNDFVDQFRSTPYWDNSIIILCADHTLGYPQGIDNLSVIRYHIPFLIVGGAVKEPRKIDTYACQSDIAATLLAQLEMDHSRYPFSKDILNPKAPHYAYFTFPDAFGIVSKDGATVYENRPNKVYLNTHHNEVLWTNKGKALLQKIYDELASKVE